MTWGMVAVGVGSAAAGYMGSQSAGKAADAQTQASQGAIGEQRRQYDTTRSDNAPFLSSGTAANRRLAMLLGLDVPAANAAPDGSGQVWADPRFQAGFEEYKRNNADASLAQFEKGWGLTPGQEFKAADPAEAASANPQFGSLTRDFTQADIDADPVYKSGLQFGLDEGRKGIDNRSIATGSYDSGATLKALTRFGNDYGSTKANDSFNRFQTQQGNTFNRLSGISGTGQTAVGQVGAAGANMANNVSNLQTGVGNANAAGIVGGANAWGSALSNGINSYMNNQTLNRLLNRGGSQNAGGTFTGSGNVGDYYPS